MCVDVLFFQRGFRRCHRRLGVRRCLSPVSRHRLMPCSRRFRMPDVSRHTGLKGVSLLRSHSLSRASCSSSCRRCACRASLLFQPSDARVTSLTMSLSRRSPGLPFMLVPALANARARARLSKVSRSPTPRLLRRHQRAVGERPRWPVAAAPLQGPLAILFLHVLLSQTIP